MHPDLIKTSFQLPGFGRFELPAYFTFVTIGFGFAIILVWRWAIRGGLYAGRGSKYSSEPEVIFDLGVLMIVTGVLGARILSVLADGHFWDYVYICIDPLKVNWPLSKSTCLSERYSGMWDPVLRVCHPDYRDCFSWLKFWRGGLAFYGGLLLSIPSGIIFLKVRKINIMKVVDATGWAIPLGLGWGRIGCFFNGCCFGDVSHSWFSVIFPSGSQASFHQFREGLLSSPMMKSIPVYPTQLIESFFSFLIAGLCYMYVEKKKRWNGQTFIAFVVLYAIGRFLEEFIRRDDRGQLMGLSTSQIIALICMGVSLAVFAIVELKRKRFFNEVGGRGER